MMVQPKPGRQGEIGQLAIEPSLERIRDFDVLDGATAGADEVMVVAISQALGQLVAVPLARRQHLLHDAGALQDDQVAVHRALGQAITALNDLGDRQGEGGLGEDADQVLASPRVALPVERQQGENPIMEIRRRHPASLRGENERERARPPVGYSAVGPSGRTLATSAMA